MGRKPSKNREHGLCQLTAGGLKTNQEFLVIEHNHIKCQKVPKFEGGGSTTEGRSQNDLSGQSVIKVNRNQQGLKSEMRHGRVVEVSSRRVLAADIETSMSKLNDRRKPNLNDHDREYSDDIQPRNRPLARAWQYNRGTTHHLQLWVCRS